MSFEYTDAEIDALDSTLSKERLDRYSRLANGNRKKAIQFYEANNVVSESMFGVIRGFEIPLRNSVHRVMSSGIGRDDWYDHLPFLQKWERDSVGRAKAFIAESKRAATPPRVISELTFGFWCGLTSKIYDAQLWVPHLHKAFPNVKIGRKAANERLERIRKIRNRIAHHECILDYKLSHEYSLIIEAIGWICPVTAAWVKHNSTLQKHLTVLASLITASMTVTVELGTPLNPTPVA